MKTKKTMISIMLFLLLAMPFALAQSENETTVIKGGKEYPLLERALDRIKLAFTLQIERKTELINRIEQRREEHYQFLLAKGKTDQAEKFKATTIGLVKNFDQWKANKAGILERIENKSIEVRENKSERMIPEKEVQNKDNRTTHGGVQ